jgi:ABC-2 type transport system permease protein
MIGTVIKKELRGYFNSAIAVIFLAAFLLVTLATFFWYEKFFARGLADLRPLFKWMPRLLIILVSALSMRQWADERRVGTLEVLLTLPVPRWQLVVGKFLAGMVLIAIALGLTLILPITIGHMGNLDLGPVVGGYLATLLLAAAYLVIGMCVSAATDNEIVAFIGTALVCGFADVIGYLAGDIGRLFGTEARFESVARGVLDLRDLAYYGGIVAVGIALNVLLLDRLTWGRGPRGKTRRSAALLAVALVAANAVGLDVWLAPIRRVRLDLTQDGAYSLSDSTRKILNGLDERLLIRGYFSEKSIPQLEALVPQLRDLLEEYQLAGGNKVRVEFVDPSDSDDAKREAKERFGIDPWTLQFSNRNERSMVNTYFAVAVEYGDQHAVIQRLEWLNVRQLDLDNLEITLKNPEYQLTRAIKKTVAEFSSVDQLFASTVGKIQLTSYMTPKTLPDIWKEGPAKLQKVVDELVKQSGGKLNYTTVEPKNETEMRDLFAKFGLKPHQLLFSPDLFYFDALVQVGNRLARVNLPEKLGDAEIKAAVIDALKRASPGFTRVVGLWEPPAPPPMPMMQGMPPQQVPPPQSFRGLQHALAGNYDVRQVQLNMPVPDDVEVLVLAGPASLDAKAAEHVDQFVMRGGALVLLDGRFRIDLMGSSSGKLALEKVATGLESTLQKWGITVEDQMVMDPKSEPAPIPETHELGNGQMMQEPHQGSYLPFVLMDGDQVSSSNAITSGLAGSVMHWASPVKADAKVGDDEHRVDVLLRSSAGSWLTTSTTAQPDSRTYPKNNGFPAPKDTDKKGSQAMAVAVVGGFASSVEKPKDKPKDAADKDAAPMIQHSPPDTRIVVFGSSAFVSDAVLGLESDFTNSNLELVHNAVDWSLADTDLLGIRSRNAAARALTVRQESRTTWSIVNIAIALLGLIAVVGFAWLRRRAVQPIISKEA